MPRVPKVVSETKRRSGESRILWARHRLNKGVARWPPYQVEKTPARRTFSYQVTLQMPAQPCSPNDPSVRSLRSECCVKPFADSDGDEILCICRGKDDERELVQCDDCRTWYHLECSGSETSQILGVKKSHPFAGEALVRHREASLGGIHKQRAGEGVAGGVDWRWELIHSDEHRSSSDGEVRDDR